MRYAMTALPWNALFALDVVLIALFAFSYYFKCYRKGYRLDFWYAQLFLLLRFAEHDHAPFRQGAG